MSYEVTKTIGGGRYRYEVESYRDPESGKTKTKWRYLGKAEGDTPPRRRVRADETRARLTSALERLLASRDWNGITAHEVAVEAGVAPATLYRYFTSRDDVLLGCAMRAIESSDRRLDELADVAGDIETERTRLRAWAISTINDTSASTVLLALWSAGLAKDEVTRARNERRRAAFETYLSQLVVLGYVSLEPSAVRELAIALALIVQAFSYRVVLGRAELGGEECDALAGAVERLIFA